MRGVETVRFWVTDIKAAWVGGGTPGRGGLGGGIFSSGVDGCSSAIDCGLEGNVGLELPVRSGVICPLGEPFVSISLSLLLLAIEGWSGGGSKPT